MIQTLYVIGGLRCKLVEAAVKKRPKQVSARDVNQIEHPPWMLIKLQNTFDFIFQNISCDFHPKQGILIYTNLKAWWSARWDKEGAAHEQKTLSWDSGSILMNWELDIYSYIHLK